MIGARMQEALNGQIQHELESAYLYLAMAAHFHSQRRFSKGCVVYHSASSLRPQGMRKG